MRLRNSPEVVPVPIEEPKAAPESKETQTDDPKSSAVPSLPRNEVKIIQYVIFRIKLASAIVSCLTLDEADTLSQKTDVERSPTC